MLFNKPIIKFYAGHTLSFLRIFVLLEYFNTYNFGLFSFTYSTAAIIASIISFGQVEFIIKSYKENPEDVIISSIRRFYIIFVFALFLLTSSLYFSDTRLIAIALFSLVHFSANIFLAIVQSAFSYTKYSNYYLARQSISFISIAVLFFGDFTKAPNQVVAISLLESALIFSLLVYTIFKIYKTLGSNSLSILVVESLQSFKFSYRSLKSFNYTRLLLGLASLSRSSCPNILNSSLYFILPNSTYYLYNILNYIQGIILLIAMPYNTNCYYFSPRKSINRLQTHSNIALISIIGSFFIILALLNNQDLFDLDLFSQRSFDTFINDFKSNPFFMLNLYRHQFFTLSFFILVSTSIYSLLDSSANIIINLTNLLGFSIYCYIYAVLYILLSLSMSILIYSTVPPLVAIVSISYLQIISISLAVLLVNFYIKKSKKKKLFSIDN